MGSKDVKIEFNNNERIYVKNFKVKNTPVNKSIKTYKKKGKKKKNLNKKSDGVSVITCTNRQGFMENVLNNYYRQVFDKKELIVVINNNSIDLNKWKQRSLIHKNIKVFKLDENISLGKCLNYAVEKSKYDFIAKFDDDDYYAKNYLKRQIKAILNTDAKIVGKRTCFVYFEKSKILALRYPNKEDTYVDYVLDSSMVIKKEIFNKIKFPDYTFKTVGPDFTFQRICHKRGIKIYATDRFDYVVHRHVNPKEHTFQIEDNKILDNSITIKKDIDNYFKYITKNYIENIKDLKVACILDEFSYECFKYECNLFQLGVDNWKEIIDKINPDILFVESAWRGYKGQWRFIIENYNELKDDSLKQLVKYSKEKNIPTVFWSKEDPYDFNKFIEASKLFEYVFTTDENCIKKYKDILKHERIFVLPFAAQPKIHNPINRYKENLGEVAFAGGCYNKGHGNRKENVLKVLKPAIKYNFHIYDRFYHREGEYYRFPKEFNSYIKKPLPYEEIIDVYKKYKVFLNINSVDDSPTNFARRVFELLACKTPTISSYALGIDNYFGDIVKLAKDKNDTKYFLKLLLENEKLRDELSVLGLREVLKKHTYKHRLKKVLTNIDFKYKEKEKLGVSIITSINKYKNIENVLKNFKNQNYEKKELILLLNNELDINIVKETIKENSSIKVYKINKQDNYKDKLKLGVKNSKYNVVSIFSEEDYYAPFYLTDLINAFFYTDALIVGKSKVYIYNEKTRDFYLNKSREDMYTDNILKSTLTFKKEIFNKIDFIKNENIIKSEIKIYSSDRFNYINITDRLYNNDLKPIDENIRNYKKYVTI
ncbi:MAG: glycosyltransferase [Firmicutes bacterium]|nr:glycosyltransferase [Bacillota bacterium]